MNPFRSPAGIRVRFVAAIAALVVVHVANAQTNVVWATDASIGLSHGAGGDFIQRWEPLAEIAASIRRDVRHGIGLDAEVGYDRSAQVYVHSDQPCAVLVGQFNCAPGSPLFPGVAGPVGLVGVTLGTADAVQLRLNSGLAAYNVNNTRLGAPMTAIDVAVAPVSWLAVVAGGRAFALPNYQGSRLTVTTWRLGLRVQSRQ